MDFRSGWHFLQTPGPTNVPERVLAAIARPTIDHRGKEFQNLSREVIEGLRQVAQTSGRAMIFPSSGTGAWEAALVNTLSPGDRVLMVETGHFATLWHNMALRWGLEVDFLPGDWRHGADPLAIEEKLREDRDHAIRAVMVVQNETSTGVRSRIAEIRQVMNGLGHPALLMVDTISSLASIDYRHDEWEVDVTIGCSQKGLMLPPGIGINIVSDKALRASKSSRFPKSYWDWEAMSETSRSGFFPYTPPTNLLYGLRESLHMLLEEGLTQVFARHERLAEATRQAVRAWGLELLCVNPEEYSNVLTAVLMPEGHDATAFCHMTADRFNMSIGQGLGKLQGKVFRIGHLGYFNEPMLAGTLGGLEMAFHHAGVPFRSGGLLAAVEYLAQAHSE